MQVGSVSTFEMGMQLPDRSRERLWSTWARRQRISKLEHGLVLCRGGGNGEGRVQIASGGVKGGRVGARAGGGFVEGLAGRLGLGHLHLDGARPAHPSKGQPHPRAVVINPSSPLSALHG